MRVLRCFNKLLDGKFAFLEWRASRAALKCEKGADSFVIRDGKICFQSIHYKVHPVSRSEGNSNDPT